MGEENSRGDGGKFWLGLLIGMVVGSAISLLYAPRSGAEIRAAIKEKAVAARYRTSNVIERARTRMAEFRHKTKKEAEKLEAKAEGL
jgi:gas vesicle protein